MPIPLAAYSGGPPLGRTGAPGEQTCLSANCHTGARIDDSPSLSLDALTYNPGSPPRRWVIRNSDPSARVYGLQLTVRLASDPGRKPAGRITALDPGTSVLCSDDRPTPAGGCPASHPLQYFQHTEPKTIGEFAVEWTPPVNDAGDILVYAASNASVSGQRNSRIHLRAFRLRSVSLPSLRNAASGLPEFSPGSWISIFGEALSTGTRSWSTADFAAGRAPQSLDGVEVRIDGRPAFPAFVSPSQINAQAPDGDREGPVRFEVLRAGAIVASGEAIQRPTVPALFAMPDGRHAAAVTRDGATGPFLPGSEILLFGTGFRQLRPAGLLVVAPWNLPAAVTIRIGAQRVTPAFAGLVQIGLYQFNVVLPALEPGEHPVAVHAGDFPTQPGLVVLVGRTPGR